MTSLVWRGVLVAVIGAMNSAAVAEELADEVRRCAAISGDAERLACYDGLSRGVSDAVVVDASQSSASTKSPSAAATAAPTATASGAAEREFGARGELARELEEERGVTRPEKLEQLAARVTEFSRLPRGEFIVKLDNGQVWAQKEPKPRLTLKPGDSVVLAAGALGSFWLSANDQRVRVARVR